MRTMTSYNNTGLSAQEIESMLGEELMKLKEQLKEVHSGANSVIENTEKLKDTIRTKIREVKVSLLKHSFSSTLQRFYYFLQW